MAEYNISGVWLDINTSEVTHYAVHLVLERTILKAEKKSKAELIALLKEKGTTAYTWMWDYKRGTWSTREEIEVAWGLRGKYLRCVGGDKVTEHLAHLINLGWIE